MSDAVRESSGKRPALWQITTQWSQVNNPAHFVVRYADAVRRYLSSWLRDPHGVDDVVQDLLVHATERGFANADPAVGRFRDYLLVIVRNAARKHLRRQARPTEPLTGAVADTLADPRPDPASGLDQVWLREWRECLLERTMRALHALEVETPGNCYATVLKLATGRPDEDQAVLADELSRRLGKVVTHAAFRQTLGRARRQFALLLIREVAGTLNAPTATDIEEELAALGLLTRIVRYLPADWRTDPEVLR